MHYYGASDNSGMEVENLVRDRCRLLLAVALAVGVASLLGVEELKVIRVGNVMAVGTCRPFPESSLVLVPMVLGHQHVVDDSVHPHRVPVRMQSRIIY